MKGRAREALCEKDARMTEFEAQEAQLQEAAAASGGRGDRLERFQAQRVLDLSRASSAPTGGVEVPPVAALAAFAFQARFRSSHLAGVLNVASDALSRWNEPGKPESYYNHRQGHMPEPSFVTCASPGRVGRARRLLRLALTGRLQADGVINRITTQLMEDW